LAGADRLGEEIYQAGNQLTGDPGFVGAAHFFSLSVIRWRNGTQISRITEPGRSFVSSGMRIRLKLGFTTVANRG
jgi:hypothetical protein